MTAEERVAALHERMDTMRRVRERRITRVMGTAGILTAVCLILLIIKGGMAHTGGTADMYSGAIMLFEGVGGYILLAILAFMAGVVITVILLKRKKQEEVFCEERPAGDNTGQDVRCATGQDHTSPIETSAEVKTAGHKKDNMINEGGYDEKKG